MPTITLRPNATHSGAFSPMTGAWPGTSGGDTVTNTSDNSDNTFIRATSWSPELTHELHLTTFSFPARSQIRSVTPRVRGAFYGPNPGTYTARFRLATPDGYTPIAESSAGQGTSTIMQITGSALTARPDGQAWTQADIDALRFVLYGGTDSFATHGWHELYVDVVYNQNPSVTNVQPSTTLTTTAQPTVTWTYNDPEGDAQERFQVKVYGPYTSAPPTVADPDYTAAPYDSGVQHVSVVAGGTGSWALPQALPSGQYRVYAKAADVGSNGRYSTWATSTFTIQVDAPAAPTLTTSVDNAQGGITVTVKGQDNRLTDNQASFETDWGAGTSGWTVTNATLSRGTAQVVHGSSSLAMASTGSTYMDVSMGTPRAHVAAGVTYTAVASVRAAVTARLAQLTLYWYAGEGGSPLSSIASTQVTNSSTAWTQLTVTGAAPTGATRAVLKVEFRASSGNLGSSEMHYLDAVSLHPGTSTTWRAGGRIDSATVMVERSFDSGTTWEAVRGGGGAAWDSAASQTVTIPDYEVPRNTPTLYRAQVTSTSPYSASSPYVQTTSVSYTAAGWWLKDPLYPVNNTQIAVAPDFSFRWKEPQTVFEPVGRDASIVISDGVRGIEGSLTLWAKDAAMYGRIETLVKSGRVLWLEDDFGRHWYIKLGAATEWSLLRATPTSGETSPIRHFHTITLPFVEVVRPAG